MCSTNSQLIEFPIFPRCKRIFPLELPSSLKPGKYSVLAVLDYSDNAPLEAIEKTIEIK